MTRTKIILGSASALAITAASAAVIAAPQAGTKIGNQAAATYESGGSSFRVESNEVTTTVAEVYALDLTENQSETATPGGFVFYPHAVSNDANTPDSFTLSATPSGTVGLQNVLIYADANDDGVPDGPALNTPGNPATSPTVPIGGSFSFLVRGTVPSNATAGQTGSLTVEATSVGDPTKSDTNTDTVTVTSGAVITLQKSQTIVTDNGPAGASDGDVVEVTLTYNNTGGATAQNVVFTDTLRSLNDQGEAIDLDYVLNSGAWSDNTGPATDIDDANDGQDASNGTDGLSYSYDGTDTITAVIDTIPQGKRGTITFRYALTDVTEGTVENQATAAWDDPANPGTPVTTPSNTAKIVVEAAYGVGLSDAQLDETGGSAVGAAGSTYTSGGIASRTDDGTARNDIVREDADAFPGGEIAFEFVLSNLSDVADTYSLSVDNTTFGGGTAFPTGTTFRFLNEGGSAVVGNEVALAAGGAVRLQVVATLPANAPGTTGGAGYRAQAVASSQADSAATGTDRVGLHFAGDVLVSSVDLTVANGATTYGTGGGAANESDGGNPFFTLATLPRGTLSYPLTISGVTGQATEFDLTAIGVPNGWTVRFVDGNGATVTRSPELTPGGSFSYTAIVTAPAGAGVAPSLPFDFAVSSPLTAADDQVKVAASVGEVVDLSIEADTNIQIAPGGVGIITHTVTNRGNSVVTDWTAAFGADDFTDQGYTAALFWDTDGSGTYEAANDQDISTLPDLNWAGGTGPLADSVTVFVRVQTPNGAPINQVETGEVAIDVVATENDPAADDGDAGNDLVLDTIKIVAGDLTLAKTQALDAACDGTVDTAFDETGFAVAPGQCVAYRIVAQNTGNQDASAVVITDNTPNFTTYEVCTANACEAELTGVTSTLSTPGDGNAGTVATNTGFTLTPGQTATLTFTVKIDG